MKKNDRDVIVGVNSWNSQHERESSISCVPAYIKGKSGSFFFKRAEVFHPLSPENIFTVSCKMTLIPNCHTWSR